MQTVLNATCRRVARHGNGGVETQVGGNTVDGFLVDIVKSQMNVGSRLLSFNWYWQLSFQSSDNDCPIPPAAPKMAIFNESCSMDGVTE